MNYKERIDSALESISSESQELINYPESLPDRAHEHADGHEGVIYYSRAHDNVRNATVDELDQAYSSFEDCGGLGDDTSNPYDRTATLLSYWLEYHRFIDLVTSELEEVRDKLEEIIDEIDSDIDDLSENDEDPDEELALWHDQAQQLIDDIHIILG